MQHTRLFKISLPLLLGASLLACSESPLTSQARVSALTASHFLPWDKLGYRPQGAERQAAGPSSVAVGPSGKVFVLDALNARVLEVASGSLRIAAKVPNTVEDLAVGEDGAFLLFSPLRARAWLFDAEGKRAGELSVPRALRHIQSISLAKSRQVVLHNVYQETFRLGSPATTQTLPAILHSRREGAFSLDDETGVVALRRKDGRAEVQLVSSRGERHPVKQRFTLDDKVVAVRLVGVVGGAICLRLEQSETFSEKGPLRLRRQAVCLDATSGKELLREALPAPGDYMPRRELALGGNPLRLVQISPGRDGLKLHSWPLGEGR